MSFKLEKEAVGGVSEHFHNNFTKPIAFNSALPLPFTPVEVGDIKCNALIDSGSRRCLISLGCFEKMNLSCDVKCVTKCKVSFLAVNEQLISVGKKAFIHFKIDKFSWDFEFRVCSKLPCYLILGFNFMKYSNMCLFPEKGLIQFAFNDNVRPYSL